MKWDKYDFSGWASKNNILCSDGRVIRQNAFSEQDGEEVPLVWNHNYTTPNNVLGRALLMNKPEGVFMYGSFNDTDNGLNAKKMLQHGDISSLSICANQLTKRGNEVVHGVIREVSLVLAGANQGAKIEEIMTHDGFNDDCYMIHFDENEILIPDDSEDFYESEVSDGFAHKEDPDKKTDDTSPNLEKEKTIGDVIAGFDEDEKKVVAWLIEQAINSKENKEENESMKHNVFENKDGENSGENEILTHADEMEIIRMAKDSSVGTIKKALQIYANDETLSHGFDEETLGNLFPDPKQLHPGAPEPIPTDTDWVGAVIAKAHKSPFSRVRTRQADISAIRAFGYKTKGTQKKDMGNISLVTRTFDPQTVYIKDKLNRDDVVDITDFDVVSYQYKVMQDALKEELATAILIGDGRDDGDEDKIKEAHIKSIWNDDELYCIHKAIDIAGQKAALQGSDTSKHFGDEYVYAESVITAALYAREKYKGSGSLEFYCTPHLLNMMLLARDLNGHRIYNSKNDLAAALNVTAIHTVEAFEGKTRKTSAEMPETMKLLGLFVNLSDYTVGSVKGGQITNFNDFDLDFNQYRYLIEIRVSGALTRVKSAIALEEKVTG